MFGGTALSELGQLILQNWHVCKCLMCTELRWIPLIHLQQKQEAAKTPALTQNHFHHSCALACSVVERNLHLRPWKIHRQVTKIVMNSGFQLSRAAQLAELSTTAEYPWKLSMSAHFQNFLTKNGVFTNLRNKNAVFTHFRDKNAVFTHFCVKNL